MSYKEKLQQRFAEYDKRPHTDYRIIAFQLAMDYHKLDTKYKKLQKENEEIKSDKNDIFYKIATLCDYIEDTDSYEIDEHTKQYLLEELAAIQQLAK